MCRHNFEHLEQAFSINGKQLYTCTCTRIICLAIGAIYCDVTLLKSGMCGEGMTSGSVIAVKTHKLSPKWTTPNDPKSKVLL